MGRLVAAVYTLEHGSANVHRCWGYNLSQFRYRDFSCNSTIQQAIRHLGQPTVFDHRFKTTQAVIEGRRSYAPYRGLLSSFAPDCFALMAAMSCGKPLMRSATSLAFLGRSNGPTISGASNQLKITLLRLNLLRLGNSLPTRHKMNTNRYGSKPL